MPKGPRGEKRPTDATGGAPKPRPPRNADDPEQSRRFIDMAREAGAEEPAEDADLILRRLASKEKPKRDISPTKPPQK